MTVTRRGLVQPEYRPFPNDDGKNSRPAQLEGGLEIAAPVLIVVLTLLSLGTHWFAVVLRRAPLLEPGGMVSHQGNAELILAYCIFGWIGLLVYGYLRGRRLPILLAIAGFALNYAGLGRDRGRGPELNRSEFGRGA